jgi:hypothetical protein
MMLENGTAIINKDKPLTKLSAKFSTVIEKDY